MAIVWESMYDEVYKYRKVRGEIDTKTKNESGERLINPKRRRQYVEVNQSSSAMNVMIEC
jgi:hypothetical protein